MQHVQEAWTNRSRDYRETLYQLCKSSPLAIVSGDHNDEMVLTPNHCLIGQMGGELAPESVDMTPGKLQQRWRPVQELIRKVWQR